VRFGFCQLCRGKHLLRHKFNLASAEGIGLSETARRYALDWIIPNPGELTINHDQTKKSRKANQAY
jgi:hypothetical protein